MKLSFGIIGLLVLVLCSPLSRAQVGADVKVVLLKGTALMTANADGSNVQTIVNDGVYKTNPRWSPSGDKILYDTPSQGTKPQDTTDNLVVITATGQLVRGIPQDTGADWAFSVDQIGWYGNSAVFLTGTVNHNMKGYLALDVNSSQAIQNIEQTTGGHADFQTCPSSTQVAYLVDARAYASTPTVYIQVNGNTVYTAQLPPAGTPYILSDLRWSDDCSRLAFIESVDTNHTFVVLFGSAVEGRIPVPTTAGWPLVVVPIGNSFAILSGPSGSFSQDTAASLYSTTTHSLQSSPTTLQQLQQREAAEGQLLKTLGGQSPDWFRQ